MIFNLKAIEKLVKEDDVTYAGLFKSDVIDDYIADDVHVDSIEEKADTLGVELRMNINYGLFHLGVKAKYKGSDDRKTYSKSYKVVQSIPKLDSSIGFNQILDHYRSWVAEGRPQEDYRGALLQTTVRNRLDTLELSTDSTRIKQAAQWMYANLGPALISGTTLGGSVAMQLYVDSIHHKEVMKLDTAEVDLAFKSGLFSLDANVNVQYKKTAEEWLNHTDCNVEIHGGSGPTSSDLGNAFKAKKYEKLDSLFHIWANSIVLSDNKNTNKTSIIAVELVPIWVLVDEYSPARPYLRNYVLQQLNAIGNRQLIEKFEKYSF